MNRIESVEFHGRLCRLVPLEIWHSESLSDAATDGELWRIWCTHVPAPEEMEAEIRRRLSLQERGSMVPFTVLDQEGVPVGMTTYMNVDLIHQRVEIGSTWYASRVQRTGLNTECKWHLLRHAFEQLGCLAVELRTSYLNQRSRRAIERIGAKLDGVLRSHQLHRDGTVRDTCVYSIIRAEWPTVDSHLRFLMDRDGGDLAAGAEKGPGK